MCNAEHVKLASAFILVNERLAEVIRKRCSETWRIGDRTWDPCISHSSAMKTHASMHCSHTQGMVTDKESDQDFDLKRS